MTRVAQMDRRQSPRVQFNGVVQAEQIPQGLAKRAWALLSEDISETGLRLSSPTFFPIKSRLLLDLDTESSVDPIRAIAKVVWIEQVPYQERWYVGVEFCDFNDGSYSQFLAIVTSH